MTISDRISQAIADVLNASALPGNPSVSAGISTALNEDENTRVIVIANSATLRKQLLPGIYDISGEVTVFKTIDQQEDETEELKADFRALCDAVEEVIGQKYQMGSMIAQFDPRLVLYSWNLMEQDSFMQNRAMGAKFAWTAFARHDPHNPN